MERVQKVDQIFPKKGPARGPEGRKSQWGLGKAPVRESRATNSPRS